jgi:EAL domain-containing protein (putative c-di-GMP-specific phosphodiesterase class I)
MSAPHPDRSAHSPSGTASSDAAAGWQFALLVRIDQFAVLRRRLGRDRVHALVAEVACRVARLFPMARVSPSSRDCIEITSSGQARDELAGMADTLDDAFATPVDVAGEPIIIDVTLGAAAAARPHDPVRLIEEAEHALAEAVADRRPVIRTVTAGIDGIDAIALARDLGPAIGAGELFIQYQPKFHVRRQTIGSVEALIRWRHPTRGLVQPNDFIPLAEQSSHIVTLTLWTIARAIADQRRLAAQGHSMPIFINIAGVLLSDPRFVRRACAIIGEAGAQIGFEITETSVIRDPDSAIANLKVFADLGIVISIDDYGAGLSSLAYLKRLPARELKIDKLFVTQLTSSNRDPLIVRSTIDLAHALEMEVVAEGVETAAAFALLSVMGCDMVQGFFISRPLEIDALVTFLDEDRGAQTAQQSRASLSRLASAWRAA